MTDVAQLEAAILADPHDPAAYLVYADYLQSQGDPRGELIVKHVNGVDVSDLLAQHHFLGPLMTWADFMPASGYRPRKARKANVTWKHGFIAKLDLSWGMYENGGTTEQARVELVEILSHPSCRFLTELDIGPVPGDDGCHFGWVSEVLAELRPQALDTVHLGDTSDWDLSSTSTGSLAELAAACPRLRDLTLHGGEVTIGDVDAPELRAVAIETGQLTEGDIRQICDAKWPKLESLEIWFGNRNYGASGTEKDVQPLFDKHAEVPHLRHLGLMNCPFVDLLIEPLAKSPLLAQLTSLDLSMGALSDAGVDVIVKYADAFRHLKPLNVDDNALTEVSGPKLRALGFAMGAEHDPDRADEDGEIYDRFVAVGE